MKKKKKQKQTLFKSQASKITTPLKIKNKKGKRKLVHSGLSSFSIKSKL